MTAKNSIPIDDAIEQARNLLQALEQSRSLDNAVRSAQTTARSRLTELLRLAKADTVISDIAPEELLQFVSRPHLIRQVGNTKRWEVFVPKMFRLPDVGWPIREEGQYIVYMVSPFVGTVMDLNPALYDAIPGLEKPDFTAHVEGDDLVVIEGDPDEVYDRVGGKKAIAERKGKRLHIKAQAKFQIYCDLIRMGVLPWAPNPIPAKLRRQPKVEFELRDYQAADYKKFLEYGAVGLYAYGGAGKGFYGLYAMAEIAGPKVVFAPSVILLELYAPHLLDEVTFLTYASLHKAMGKDWSLAVFDEVHRLVATTYMEAAYVKAATRIGMSATPVRTDGREDLIAALCGVPCGINWPITDIAKPIVTVWVVKSEADKMRKCLELAQLPRRGNGKVLIYADHIAVGQAVADKLGVPFVHGKTQDPLEVVQANPTVVLSRVGDMGLSFDIDRIIQVDYAGSSQAQEGQRALRAGHETNTKSRRTEMHILCTPDQWKRFVSQRTLIYRRWGIGVDVRVAGAMSEEEVWGERPRLPGVSRRPGAKAAVPQAPRAKVTAPAPTEPKPARLHDEIDEVLALPRVAGLLSKMRVERPVYLKLVFRACYNASLSVDEICEALNADSQTTRNRIRACARALHRDKLLVYDEGSGRYTVNHDEVRRLRSLSELGMKLKSKSG